MIKRRGLIAGIGIMLAAPAVVHAEQIMRVVSFTPVADMLESYARYHRRLPDGDYPIERKIIMPQGGRLVGSGNSVIKMASAFNGDCMVGALFPNTSLENLTFQFAIRGDEWPKESASALRPIFEHSNVDLTTLPFDNFLSLQHSL